MIYAWPIVELVEAKQFKAPQLGREKKVTTHHAKFPYNSHSELECPNIIFIYSVTLSSTTIALHPSVLHKTLSLCAKTFCFKKVI